MGEFDAPMIAKRVEHIECPSCGLEQWYLNDCPAGGEYECDECKTIFRVLPKHNYQPDGRHHYQIHFKAINANGAYMSTHSRYCDSSHPIEYASDITGVEAWAAKAVGAASAVLVGWTALKGNIRPDDQPNDIS